MVDASQGEKKTKVFQLKSATVVIMYATAIQYHMQKLFQSNWGYLRQSLTATPAESLTLRMKFQEQSAVAAKLLQVAEENDKHVLAMVA